MNVRMWVLYVAGVIVALMVAWVIGAAIAEGSGEQR